MEWAEVSGERGGGGGQGGQDKIAAFNKGVFMELAG